MAIQIKRRFAIGTEEVERVNSSCPKIDSRVDMSGGGGGVRDGRRSQ